MNKLIQLALFFTLILTGCSNSSTSSEPKAETVKTAAAFSQKELEKELKKLKPVSLDMKFESPLATELGKRKAKEEAEKQRQIAAEKKLEKEREAAIQKEQKANAEKKRQSQAQRQQTESSSPNSKDLPSTSSQKDKIIQQPASELPDDDGYGYEERKKWHDDQVEWGIKQGYNDPEDAP
ncbi:hypothetical protein [Bacillus subtilis]|uniref:hypothetical protein n=1 Tax=Bacillus subtilis TaxID=1423 RepID=UPI002E2434E2|nr:hypothetical protein [Bacillus subtilis]